MRGNHRRRHNTKAVETNHSLQPPQQSSGDENLQSLKGKIQELSIPVYTSYRIWRRETLLKELGKIKFLSILISRELIYET